MSNSLRRLIGLLLSLLLIFTMAIIPTAAADEEAIDTTPIKILAIGNSYSNNSTEYISAIAESMGLDITAASLYQAGCPLKRHVEYYEAYETLGKDGYYSSDNKSKYEALYVDGAKVSGNASIQEAIAYTDWDYITIQQMPDYCDDITSYWTEENPYITKLYGYVLEELAANNNTKCEILLHQGWSFSHAMSIDNAYNYYPVDYENTNEFFKAIEATVVEAADILKTKMELNAAPEIVLSGKAMQLAKDQFGFADTWGDELSLYADSISHLSPLGRYLVGCVWIETFAAKAGLSITDTRTATYVPTDLGVTEEMAVLLRSCAHEAVTGVADTVYGDWRAIPYEDGLKITHFVGEAPATGTVTIPALLGEKSVLSVGEKTFWYVDGVTGVVTISNSVKIEEGALDGIKVLPTFWDGSSVPPSTGSGDSEEDPMLITNAAELYWAVKNANKNKYFKLANDIYINDIAVDVSTGTVAGKETAIKWHDSTSNTAFSGHLDGDNHTVSGLYIDYTYTAGTDEAWTLGFGLIPNGGAFTIKNLGVVNSYVNAAGACASALVGEAGSTSSGFVIENSFVGEDVYLSGAAVGGVIGSGGCKNSGKTFKIENVYSLATVSATTDYYGNITGQVWSTGAADSPLNVNNCYAIDRIYGQGVPICKNSYAGSNKGGGAISGITLLTAENMQGDKSASNMNKLWENYVVTDTYPILRSFSSRTNGEWSGFRNGDMAGAGTDASPWLIATPENLAYVAYGNSTAEKHYKLVNDIYFNDIEKIDYKTGEVAEGYTAISWLNVDASFNGTFEGSGHVVYGLWYPAGNEIGVQNAGKGLFSRLGAGSTIKNLGMSHCYIDARGYVGAIVGYITSSGAAKLIDSCYTDETVTVIGRRVNSGDTGIAASGIVGGINGCKNLTISNCYSLATVKGDVTVRKVLSNIWNGSGKTDAEIEAMNNRVINCYADGEITYGNGNSNRVALVENCYSSAAHNSNTTKAPWTEIAVTAMTGAKALDRMPGLGDAYIAVAKDYPVLKVFAPDATEPDKSFWDGSYVPLTKGSGTDTDPYLITNEEEFAYIIYSGGTEGAYYKLTTDIYLNRLDKINWATGALFDENYPVNEWFTSYTTGGDTYYNGINDIAFSGIIDGDGHTVYGLYYTPGQPGTTCGLVPAVKNATIKNLALKDSFVASGRWTAAVVGCIYTSGNVLTVDNVLVDESVTVLAYNSGNYYYDGRTGSDRLKASSPFSGIVATGVSFESCAAGGIVGFVATSSTANVTNCAVYAKFDGTSCTAAYANPYSNGGEPVKVSGTSTLYGLMGTCWNPKALNFDNCITNTNPVNNGNSALGTPNFTMFNVYNAGSASTRDGVINIEEPTKFVGPTALELAPELSADVWYAVDNAGKMPSLRVIGTEIGDVDEDGEFTVADDSAALRVVIIKGTSPSNGDADKNGEVDICDLVALQLK